MKSRLFLLVLLAVSLGAQPVTAPTVTDVLSRMTVLVDSLENSAAKNRQYARMAPQRADYFNGVSDGLKLAAQALRNDLESKFGWAMPVYVPPPISGSTDGGPNYPVPTP